MPALDTLFNLLVTQAWQVSLLATVVLLLVRLLPQRLAHLRHALWALVLLKCVLPPVVASPTGVFSWLGSPTQQPTPATVLVSHSNPNTPSVAATKTPPHFVPISDKHKPRMSDPSAAQSTWFIVLCWATLCLLSALYFLIRFVTFLIQVQKASPGQPTKLLSELTEQLTEELGIRRRVRIRILNAPIGPAIMGLISPTILLPRVIVERCSQTQLRALIAHELVHFRRGDLWWSLLQTLAASATWFNPLVWLAARRLSYEAENCCDEETVTSLDMSPGAYARCLVAVLEQKHTLQVAPSLPGVRPIDVTAKRLERVMRFGQGSQSRCPAWVKAWLLAGAAIVLPGFPLTLAQDGERKEDKGQKYTLKPAQPAAPVQDQAQDRANVPETFLKYNIHIVEIPYDKAMKHVADWDTVRHSISTEQSPLASDSQDGKVIQASYAKTASPSVFFNKSTLDPKQVEDILQDGKILAQPQMISIPGVPSSIAIGGEVPLVKNVVDDANADDGAELKQVEFRRVGISMEVTGDLTEDQKSVRLSIQYEHTHLQEKDKVAASSEKPSAEQAIDVPRFSIVSFETARTGKLGEMIAICSGPVERHTIVEQKIPLLDSVPYVRGLFKNVAYAREDVAHIVLINCEHMDAKKENVPKSTSDDGDTAEPTVGEILPQPAPTPKKTTVTMGVPTKTEKPWMAGRFVAEWLSLQKARN